MQIVIEIDEEDYKRIQDTSDVFNSLTSRTYSAIRNGTPLPENHGRLIDAEKVYQKAFEDIRAEIWDSGMNMTGEYQGVWIRYRDIEKILDKYNPDKAESEDEE